MLLVFLVFINPLYTPNLASATVLLNDLSANNASGITGSDNNNINNTAINITGSFLTYKNSTLGVSIGYPPNWQIIEGHQQVLFVPPLQSNQNIYPEHLRIGVENFTSNNNTLSMFVQGNIDNLKTHYENFDLIQSTSTKLDDEPAKQIIYTTTSTGTTNFNLTVSKLYTIKYDKAYIITYEAQFGKYSQNLPTIQDMIHSFQLTK